MSSVEQAVSDIENSDKQLITVCGNFSINELASLLNDRDFHAVIIDRAPVINRDTLLHAMYQHLRFPGYFGFTWDSLKDILAGMDGVRDKGFVFAFSDLSLLPEDDRREFLEVIEDANEVRDDHENLAKLRVVALKA